MKVTVSVCEDGVKLNYFRSILNQKEPYTDERRRRGGVRGEGEHKRIKRGRRGEEEGGGGGGGGGGWGVVG